MVITELKLQLKKYWLAFYTFTLYTNYQNSHLTKSLTKNILKFQEYNHFHTFCLLDIT